MRLTFKLVIWCSSVLMVTQLPAQNILSKNDTLPVVVEKEERAFDIPFFNTTTKSLNTGAVTVIEPEEIRRYDHIFSVTEFINGRVPGLIGGTNLRGMGSALVLIDGVPRPLSSIMMTEIDQIVIVKDVSTSVLYGVQAANGLILIRTKKGASNTRVINASVEYGVYTPVALPKYLDAPDYMKLYNEALSNDGLPLRYSDGAIDSTRRKLYPVKFPDVNYYSDEFLKKAKPGIRANIDFSGGGDNAQYYLNLGWQRLGSLLNMGEGANGKQDRLNMRSNLDFKINQFIKSKINVSGVFNIFKNERGNFFNDAATLLPNQYAPLIDTSLIHDNSILKTATIIPGGYLLGGSSIYQNNVLGNLHLAGYSNTMSTAVQFNNQLEFDLKGITKGLTFRTLFSFDYVNQFEEFQDNQYAVYEPLWKTGTDGKEQLTVTKIGLDRFSGAQGITNTALNRRLAVSGMFDYERGLGKASFISASLFGYMDRYGETDLFQPEKHAHIGARVFYSYAGKYLLQLSNAVVASPKFSRQKRMAASPAVALGWVLSNEPFLANNPWINYLKLRAGAGILNTDINFSNYFAYENIYESSTTVTWNDVTRSNSTTIFSGRGNPNLSYEKKKEINLGLDAAFFNNTILLNANYFMNCSTDLITERTRTLPVYLGGVNTLENYGERKISGFEAGLSWNKHIGDFYIATGLTATLLRSKVIRTDEIWLNDYQYRTGKPTWALFGLEAQGLFKDEQEIADHATQTFGTVKPGDIKYKDQNNDGVVDAQDEIYIGNGLANTIAGLSVMLQYRNFSLFVLANSSSGPDRFYTNNYYRIYGNLKYSDVVLDRWTPATAQTATYPRLSTAYSSNNYQTSSFWLKDVSSISLSRVQLTYFLPGSLAGKLHTKNTSVYIRASDLARFAKNRKMLDLNVGSEPQYRLFAAGVKMMF